MPKHPQIEDFFYLLEKSKNKLYLEKYICFKISRCFNVISDMKYM